MSPQILQANHHCETGGFNDSYAMTSTSIGKGPNSEIYLGTNKENAGDVAVKVIYKSKLIEHERDQVENEVRILRGLSHPNILRK